MNVIKNFIANQYRKMHCEWVRGRPQSPRKHQNTSSWEKVHCEGVQRAESLTRYRKAPGINIINQVSKCAREGVRGRSLRLVTAKPPITSQQIKLGKEDMRRSPEGDRKALWEHDVHLIQKSGYETVRRYSVKQTVFFCCAQLRFATALFFGASPHALLGALPLDPARGLRPVGLRPLTHYYIASIFPSFTRTTRVKYGSNRSSWVTIRIVCPSPYSSDSNAITL